MCQTRGRRNLVWLYSGAGREVARTAIGTGGLSTRDPDRSACLWCRRLWVCVGGLGGRVPLNVEFRLGEAAG